MKKPKTLTLTYQQRLDLTDDEAQFLTRLMTSYQKHKRSLWQSLYGRCPELRPTDLNDFKRGFCLRHQISSTAYNSLKSEVDALFKAQCELLATRQVELKAKRQSLSAWIAKKAATVVQSLAKISQLASDLQAGLRDEIATTRAKLHQKKRKLADIERKIEANTADLELGKDWRPAIAFGSKKLLRAQHHLAENGYSSHAQWQSDFAFSRSSSVYLLGDQGEKSRNREVKGVEVLLTSPDMAEVGLRITIPEHMRPLYNNKANFQLSPATLDDRTLTAVKEALAARYVKEVRKKGCETTFKEMSLPVSYRFLRRKRIKTLKDGTKTTSIVFYMQIILQKLERELVSTPEAGAIGVDQNLDHIAVGIVDRFGNPGASFTIPFRPYENTAGQNKALVGAITADIVALAEHLKLPVVAEKLNFQRKMSTLKDINGRKVNHRFSAFSYAAFDSALHTRCFKQGVGFCRIEPAYSSLIGAMNYLNMKHRISSHEAACFTIARRGLNFNDYLNFGATEAHKSPAPLEEKTLPQRCELDAYRASRPAGKTGHLWAFIAQKDVKSKFKQLAEFYAHGNSWLGRGQVLGDAANPKRVALNYEALCGSG